MKPITDSHTEKLQMLTEKAEYVVKSMNEALDSVSECLEEKDFVNAKEQLDLYNYLLNAADTLYEEISSLHKQKIASAGVFVA